MILPEDDGEAFVRFEHCFSEFAHSMIISTLKVSK